MPAWWDSVDAVTTFTWWMRWIAFSFTVLAAICGGFVLIGTKRGDTLKAARDAEGHARAAKAEEELFRLKERLAPREITSTQRTKLVKILSRNPSPIFIACKLLDVESCALADQFEAVFREAKWGVLTNKTSLNSFVGITVFTNPEGAALPGFDTVLLALKEAGIEHGTVRFKSDSSGVFPPEAIFLVVGIKE